MNIITKLLPPSFQSWTFYVLVGGDSCDQVSACYFSAMVKMEARGAHFNAVIYN